MSVDYRNWPTLSIPYSGDWSKHIEIENYLKDKVGKGKFEVRVVTAWKTPRQRYSTKTVSEYVYYISNPKEFTLIALKYS